MELGAVAAELYGLPPDQFTVVRNERADGARTAGDTVLAAVVRKLRKPTVAAYAMNLLARQRQEDLGGLVDLGEQMRAASAARDGAALRDLSRRRHHLIAALLSTAGDLAAAAGHPLSDSAQREVETSLQAAVMDPACAQDLLAGQLSGPLRTDGLAAFGRLGTVDLRTSDTGTADDPPDTATRVLRDAEDALERAVDAAAEADENTDAARDAGRVAEQHLAAATAHLRRLRAQLEAAEQDHAKAQRSAASASASLADATAASELARAAEVAARDHVRSLQTNAASRGRPR